MSDDRCPKCGKAAMVHLLYKRGHPSAPILTRRKRWVCESFSEVDREFAQSPVCRITELEQELARRRTNTLLGLRGIEAAEDDPDPEFRLGVLAGGLKAEVEKLRALLHEAWVAADKGEIDGVDLGWVAKCDKLFASAASEPKGATP